MRRMFKICEQKFSHIFYFSHYGSQNDNKICEICEICNFIFVYIPIIPGVKILYYIPLKK